LVAAGAAAGAGVEAAAGAAAGAGVDEEPSDEAAGVEELSNAAGLEGVLAAADASAALRESVK
jgi:hypothetical protein